MFTALFSHAQASVFDALRAASSRAFVLAAFPARFYVFEPCVPRHPAPLF
jgi:hypothetical protein